MAPISETRNPQQQARRKITRFMRWPAESRGSSGQFAQDTGQLAAGEDLDPLNGPGRNEHESLTYMWCEDVYLDSRGIASVELTEVVN